MLRFLLKKLLRMSVILVGATLITFLLMHAIPGDPWSNYSSSPRMMAGSAGDMALQRQLNRRFGLDLPKWRQFTRYIIGDFSEDGSFFCGAVCGNLGPSIQQRGRSVRDVLFSPPERMSFWKSRFGYSIRLVLFASLIAAGVGIPLGVWSATRPRSVSSRTISVGLAALVSIPNFVLGLLAIVILASWLKLIKVLPDWDLPSNWIVPALVLAIVPMAGIARVTRASVLNVLHEDYIRTARGKGLQEGRVIRVHMLRNASVPIITFMGPTLMEMFTGLLIVENLYAFPGFGRGFWQAVLDLDYPMILALTLIFAIGIVLVNTLIEILCEILDPRLRSIKYQGAP
jgi:oligopeptide transport system permease protein